MTRLALRIGRGFVLCVSRQHSHPHSLQFFFAAFFDDRNVPLPRRIRHGAFESTGIKSAVLFVGESRSLMILHSEERPRPPAPRYPTPHTPARRARFTPAASLHPPAYRRPSRALAAAGCSRRTCHRRALRVWQPPCRATLTAARPTHPLSSSHRPTRVDQENTSFFFFVFIRFSNRGMLK